jgi:hypothetical protein
MAEQPTNIIVESGGESGSKKAISSVIGFLTHEKLGRFFLACLFSFVVFIISQRFIKFVWPLSLFWTVLIFALVILGVSFGANSVILILSIIGLPLLFILLGSTLPNFSPLFKLNPIVMVVIVLFWIAFVFIATQSAYQNKKSALPLLLVLFNIAIYALLMWPLTSQMIFAGFQIDAPIRTAVTDQQAEWGNIWENLGTGLTKARMEAQRQVNIASGNYEAGVEAQSKKPLGIFLENTGTNSPIRYPGDLNLKIFGYIKAVTPNPEDKFKISSECYGVASKETKNKATFYPPGDVLEANDYKSVDCLVPISQLSLITANTQAVLETTFDFKTSSFVKTYFMEQDVIRSYRMQNLDPLDEYQIQDKNPVAVYTGGPLMVGMRAGAQQPVPLVKDDPSGPGPSLDITLDRTAQWPEGELMKVNKLTVYLPPGLKFVNAKANCRDEADSQVCELNPGEYVKSETDKPIMMPIKLRFETKLDSGIDELLGGAPLAVHSFKLDTEYTFRIKKTFDVRVTHEAGASS